MYNHFGNGNVSTRQFNPKTEIFLSDKKKLKNIGEKLGGMGPDIGSKRSHLRSRMRFLWG
jgi:hypothetical protein